jgi:hypothetical protein
MKIKALLLVLIVAGFTASLALAKPPKPAATTTTMTAPRPKCDQVELKGNATTGGITFTVARASKRGRALVGTTVTLAVPAGAKIKAKACTTAGTSALTLRELEVKVPKKPKP